MRVMCLTEPKPIFPCDPIPNPKAGDIDVVIDSGWDEHLGDYYCLERFGVRYGYSQIHFIPLSSICETEMIRNYNTQNV